MSELDQSIEELNNLLKLLTDGKVFTAEEYLRKMLKAKKARFELFENQLMES